MKNGTLILLCGLPGAGKTTYAKELALKIKAVRFSPDEWIISIMKERIDITERDRLRAIIEPLQWKLAQELLSLGNTVILENGFWPTSERKEYRQTAQKLGARVELVFLDAPFSVIRKRVVARNQNLDKSSFNIAEAELRNFSDNLFNPPTHEEGAEFDRYEHIAVRAS